MVNKQQQQQQQKPPPPPPPTKNACLQTTVYEEGKESSTTTITTNERKRLRQFFIRFLAYFVSNQHLKDPETQPSVLSFCVWQSVSVTPCVVTVLITSWASLFPLLFIDREREPTYGCALTSSSLHLKTAVLLHNTYEQNYHPKSANGNACTISTFSEQLASLLGVPFNFHNTSRFVQFCSWSLN